MQRFRVVTRRPCALTGLAAACLATAGAASAQTPVADAPGGNGSMRDIQELQSELQVTETEEGTLRRASQLQAGGDLTAAATLLERYLLANRNAIDARAEYAIALCRLDDIQAGLFEKAKLASIPAGGDVMERISSACDTAR